MRKSEPLDLALLGTAALVVVGFALTGSYGQLVAAVAAYGVAWWVLGLQRPRSGDPR